MSGQKPNLIQITGNLTFNPAISFPDDDWREIDAAVIQQQSREKETVQSKTATSSSLSLNITTVVPKKTNVRDKKKGKTLLMGEANLTPHYTGTQLTIHPDRHRVQPSN